MPAAATACRARRSARPATTGHPDELAGTEQPFVSHLIELRDRLIRASIAVGVVLRACSASGPGPGALYDLLAAPLVAHLPQGATLIATNVISPFLVPLKITLMAAFLLALPVVLYQVWAFVAPGLYTHEKKLVLPLVVSSTLLFFARRRRSATSSSSARSSRSSRASRRRASRRRRTSRPTSASC